MIPYKYSQLSKRLDYATAINNYKVKDLHLGQLKLFFAELLFLSKWAKNGNKVLYVGAANGYHIGKLAQLFPNLDFDLWDPGKFEVKETSNIKIYNNFFTEDVAKSYQIEGPNILLMCDIRNIKIAEYKKKNLNINKMDQLVMTDMNMQLNWVQLINPICAYLKFRLPYLVKTMKYLSGKIYLQPYNALSTEARLMTNKYNNYTEYDTLEFDEKLSYFNYITRQNIKSKKWDKYCAKYNIVNNWDNVVALYITQNYLRNILNIKSNNKTCKLFLDIIDYHILRFGSKYDIIFNS